MTVKFNEKNVSIFAAIQTAEGVPASPIAADTLPVTTLTGTVQRETEAFEYLGDSLSRDEITTLKDESGEISFETFAPHLGTLNPSLPVANAPMQQFFKACGGAVSVDATTGAVTVTNSVADTSLLTIDYHKSSPETSGGLDKRWRFPDSRGTLDVSFDTGSRVKFAFKFLSNASAPSMKTAVTPDFGNQKLNVASVVRKANMQKSVLRQVLGTQPIYTIANISVSGGTVTVQTSASHGYTTGILVDISGTTNFNEAGVEITVTGVDTFTYLSTNTGAAETAGSVTQTHGVEETMCVNNINATNFFGFSYDRYLMTCQEGFSKVAVPTDLTMTVLEDEVGGTDFDPDANIENIYQITFKYGTGAGKYVSLLWDKVQLANVTDGKVASFFGKDMTFRNVGTTSIVFE